MTDLVQFLRDRYDEDEASAIAAAGTEGADTWTTLPGSYGGVLNGTGDRSLAVGYGDFMAPATAIHIARHDPARVLAEVEAKRRLLEQFRLRGDSVRAVVQPSTGGVWDDMLRLLALPYADHSDYRNEWRP